MLLIPIAIAYAIIVLTIVVMTLLSIVKGIKKSKTLFAEFFLYFSEVIFTVIAPIIGFMRFDKYQPQIPFSKQHVLSIILLVFVASVSFWSARAVQNTKNPIIKIALSVGMLQGMIICFITTIHFIPFIPLGLTFPTAGFEILSPVVAFFLLLREFYFFNRLPVETNETIPYRTELGFTPLSYQILNFSFTKKLLVYFILFTVLILLQVILASPFGQDFDSILKAYTHSVGFIFSTHPI